jgi:uncharacterized delta-60 repeat protein
MNGRIVRILLWTGLLVLLSGTSFAQERWVYRYNGSAGHDDLALSIVAGPDSNLYAAGYTDEGVTDSDFTVLSLTDSGTERWVYRYSALGGDAACCVITGSDSNIYAAGHCDDYLTVVSLTVSGAERWVYQYKPVRSLDIAYSIVMGSDGNLYAAGRSFASGTDYDFVVVSLTDSGTERWVYRYDGPAGETDEAYSVVVGSDGNIYAAGRSLGNGTSFDFVVVSLADSGTERWVYRYDGPANWTDQANSIVMDSDGNLYAAGRSYEAETYYDFTVVSLTPSGSERWVYRYNGPAGFWDKANSIVMGMDGDLYAAGSSDGIVYSDDITVVSLTPSGDERWVYRYNGPGNSGDNAYSIMYGSDGNIYVAGASGGSGTSADFTVVSLAPSGAERWVYRYNGPGNSGDVAYSIVCGSDGSVYAAGQSSGSGTLDDVTVISLSPDVGVAERLSRPSASVCHLLYNRPNPVSNSTLISYSLPSATNVTLSIYDITGRLVETLVNGTQQPGIHQVRWIRKENPSGVYFYRLKAGEFVQTRKMVVVE